MENFQELGLPEFLGHSLKQMNFTKPTPVQAQAIPAALEGKDVIASAQTGTGKTAAFGIPLLAYLEKHKDKTALVMTPTRELAMQVLDVLRKLSGAHPLGGSVLLIGGANMGAQFTQLSHKPRLVIGTPGRIIDHLNRGSLSLGRAGFLVLDEADRMLDMGFAPQLEQIRQKLQADRQTLLFSATIPPDIQAMGSKYLRNPVRISIGSTTQPIPKIAQKVLYTTEAKKPEELFSELKERQGSVLIFARTQHRVDRIMDRLKEQGLKVTRIHGGRTQSQRRQAIDQFREGKFLILVATDIAARGLDIHHIAHVINYDLPRNPEDYVHRVGRTARAGAEGESLCFITPEDGDLWRRILKLMGASKESIPVKPSRFGFTAPRPEPTHTRHPHPQARPPHQAHPKHGTPRHPGHPHQAQKPAQHQRFDDAHRKQFDTAHPKQFEGAHRKPGQGHFQRNNQNRDDRNFRGEKKGFRHEERGFQPGGEYRRKNRPSQGQHPHRQERNFRPEGSQGHSRRDNFIFHGPEDRQPGQNEPGEWKPQKPNFIQRIGKKFMGENKPRGHNPKHFRHQRDFRK